MARLDELLSEVRMTTGDRIHGNMFVGLYRMVQEYYNSDFVVVEIGNFQGASTELFALTCKHVYAVDPYTSGFSTAISESDLIMAEACFIERMKNYPNVTKLRKPSVEASKGFEDGSVDAVYIDGDHNYEAVIDDMNAWMPKLKPTGILSGHDINDDKVSSAVESIIGMRYKGFIDFSWAARMEKILEWKEKRE